MLSGIFELPLGAHSRNHSIISGYFSWNLRVAVGRASSVRATIKQLPSWDMAAKRESQINRGKQKEVWSEGGRRRGGNGTTTCGATLISLPEKWHARWTHNYGRNKVICRNCNWAEGRQLRRPFRQVAAPLRKLCPAARPPQIPSDTPLYGWRLCFKVGGRAWVRDLEFLDNVWQCLEHLPRTEGDFNLARTYLATPKAKGEWGNKGKTKGKKERGRDRVAQKSAIILHRKLLNYCAQAAPASSCVCVCVSVSVSVLSFQQTVSYDVFMTLLSAPSQSQWLVAFPIPAQFHSHSHSFCVLCFSSSNDQVNSYYYGYYVCSMSTVCPSGHINHLHTHSDSDSCAYA